MNKFILMLQNFKYMIMKRGGIFFAALLSLSICICGLLFYGGYLFKSFYNSKAGGNIKIELSSYDKNEVKDILSELECRYGEVEFIDVRDENNIKVIGYYSKINQKLLMSGKTYSIDDDENVLLVDVKRVDVPFDSETLEAIETPIGKKVKIGKNEYKTIGVLVFSNINEYMIPIDNFVENFNVSSIEVGYVRALSHKDVKRIKKYLNGVSLIKDYKIIAEKDILSDKNMVFDYAQVILIFLACFINTFGVLYYWISYFRRNYTIFRICGASVVDNIMLIAMQSSFFLFLGTMTGNIIFCILMRYISKYEIVYDESFIPYVGVSLLFMMALILFSVLLAVKIGRKKELYRVAE